MKMLVKNFRGIERAEIEAVPIALLAGKNFQGKSSICQAVAAALTGHTVPFLRPTRDVGKFASVLTKTESKELVRGGVDEGAVSVTTADGSVSVAWPKLESASKGKPPAISVYAAGMMKIMEVDPMFRFELLSALLETMPTSTDLDIELKDAELDEATRKQVIEKVEQVGYDVAHKALADSTKLLKGRWEEATGESFGMKKMEGWKPQGYDLTPGVTSAEDIETTVANARQSVENAVASQAVDAAEITRLNDLAPLEHDAKIALDAAYTALNAYNGDLKRHEADLESIEVPEAPLPCPDCGSMLGVTMKDGKPALHRAGHTITQIQTASTQRDSIKGLIVLTKTRISTATRDRQKALGDWEKYKGSLAALEAAVSKTGSAQAVITLRENLVAAEKLRDQFNAITKAAKYAETIKINATVLEVLEPEGLRRSKLAKKLQDFNGSTLTPLTAAAGYAPVTIDDKLDVRLGGRHYYLLSESEKFRVNTILQIAIAMLDKSICVIIDGADILDTAGRNGLFAMLASIGDKVNSLVGLTVTSKKTVPDLGKHGMGRTYWIEDGIAADFAL